MAGSIIKGGGGSGSGGGGGGVTTPGTTTFRALATWGDGVGGSLLDNPVAGVDPAGNILTTGTITGDIVAQNDAAYIGNGHVLIATEVNGSLGFYNANTDEVLGTLAFDSVDDETAETIRRQARLTLRKLRERGKV